MRKICSLSFLVILASGLAATAADKGTLPSATAEFRLGPGSIIDVFVWKEPDLCATVTVRPDGKISLPLAGELDAAGKTAIEMQNQVADKLQQ